MTTYNTGNPIGSAAPEDLYDNSENLDIAVNGTGSEWTDRLGNTRKTFQAAENAAQQVEDARDATLVQIYDTTASAITSVESTADQAEQDITTFVDGSIGAVTNARNSAITDINNLKTEGDNALTAAESSWEDRFISGQDDRESRFVVEQDDRSGRFAQFLVSSGYQPVGDYAPGLTLTEYNQIVRFSGAWFRISASVDLPYTTTDWATDESNFVGINDATLRGELDSGVASEQGALLVKGSVFYADGLASLESIPSGSLTDGQRATLSDGSEYAWDAASSEWNYVDRSWLNNKGSTDASSQVDWANYPDVNRRAHVIHHYNDAEVVVYDNVGEDNLFMLLRNARNPTRRFDKPDTFYGTADFLRCQNIYPYQGGYTTVNVFELLYDGTMSWGNQALTENNNGVTLENAQVTNNNTYSFTLKTNVDTNTDLLDITASDTASAFNFRCIGGALARLDAPAAMTSGMYIAAEGNKIDIAAPNGLVRLEAQNGKDYYVKTNTGYGWIVRFVDFASRPTATTWQTAPGERGDFWADGDGSYVYVCYAPNRWCRIPAETV